MTFSFSYMAMAAATAMTSERDSQASKKEWSGKRRRCC